MRPKDSCIEEANDINTLKIEELIGSLMSLEAQMQGRRESKAIEKKSIAFNTTIDDLDLDNDDDEEENAS